MDALIAPFETTLRSAGYLAKGGLIVEATIRAEPKLHNTEAKRAAFEAGGFPKSWAERPAWLREKVCDARWTVKARPREDGVQQVDLAVPVFGYWNQVLIVGVH